MSARDGDDVHGTTEELGPLAELACDEALFGIPQLRARDLDESGDVTATLRDQLALVASGLALRSVTQQESLPASVRGRLQAQAFEYFERQGLAPLPTATTTGANVVELVPATPAPHRSGSRWLSVLFAAACFLGIAVTARWRLQRNANSPASVVTQHQDVLPQSLRATHLGSRAELAVEGTDGAVVFTWQSATNEPLPASTFLWIRAVIGEVYEWRRIGVVSPGEDGTARLAFDPGPVEKIVGFAVAAPRVDVPDQPDLEHARAVTGGGD